MTTVVIDASVALGWFLPSDNEEMLRYSASVHDAIAVGTIRAAVPNIFFVECSHKLLRHGRSARWGEEKVAQCAAYIQATISEIVAEYYPMEAMVRRAHEFHLQGYDSLYFVVARVNDWQIATLDKGILTACRRFGVETWAPASV
ncbi:MULTISPECIES: type II toxin-antitoxin system VapC family toxin [unclassified Cupriavidus]|uniref:type II toxin-antitoxin system VapC family toxin n=1 Tax=unclassified Cupriavidus TaxID=2640874 RepID=UPI001AE8632E|nr:MULTISPECIES: type II toxin-antitoxin system VapC family toxin [unclassified Cupriavidus]MBP0633588.1 type II toxin-antitoxin system VapC family toxin [Cupriavidus sp. AcVe19-1a]MBP0639626.1 type II toxin-antitoxin system VapC family toxin [Cupriavidus sp. AcVe19-6a]